VTDNKSTPITRVCHVCLSQGSFRGGTRGNAVPIVKVKRERTGTQRCCKKRQRNVLLSYQRSPSLHFLPSQNQ